MAVSLLLFIGVGIELLCCLGVWAGRNPYARLHFIGPATILGSSFIAAAILVQDSFSQSGIKGILVVLILLATGPILSHATARAIYVRNQKASQKASDSVKKEGK